MHPQPLQRGFVVVELGQGVPILLQQDERLTRNAGLVVNPHMQALCACYGAQLFQCVLGYEGGGHYATPSTRRSSDTGHARRPLMRMGRIGPSSRQAQMRSVCCARLRCPAASLVGSAARVSCASGVSSWCAIVESLSGLLRWLYWLAATPAARNMQPLANCEKPYFMRVAARFMQPLQPLSF